MSDLVDSVIAECRRKRPGDIAETENAVPETQPPLCADPTRLGRMLAHLVGNSLRFTPAAGSIRIEAGIESGRLRLSVTDTGCGIPENRLADLQEPFVQVSTDWQNHSEGAGLGLTYVRNLARCHGGGFELASIDGKGTIAVLTLPM